MKKALRQTQTLCAGCSKAETKIYAPLQTPSLGARDGQNLISWRWWLPLPTDPVWWGSMHAISSYRGNRLTHTHKHRQVQLQYAVPQLASTQCNNNNYYYYEQAKKCTSKFCLNMQDYHIICMSASGRNFFGSALLQPARSVCVSLSAFSSIVQLTCVLSAAGCRWDSSSSSPQSVHSRQSFITLTGQTAHIGSQLLYLGITNCYITL